MRMSIHFLMRFFDGNNFPEDRMLNDHIERNLREDFFRGV